MSKLAEYKALEARLAEQLKQLDALKNDDELKSEIEFEEKLRKLMDEYDVNLRSVIALLDPEASRGATAVGRGGARRQRQVKVYKNPNTGEVVETKGGNHRVLKAWKEEHGAETVDSWLQ
ncbi:MULTISPECIES: histone-like nucleoid-structuring protein, MvaT/MvaU family [unclassified Pseudomonas]|uniref:histone-like nucleoid-structuring protein, MvaT/MvaU family n=1 Tax=unclassified Pseudomonas TaxID=196821 RepID=UPI0024494DE1|nr:MULTISPECIES: histone-like nucleoid-structuring protein, MvaT/MvaU family [unclassified Pseudomonas]MDH0897621.1 DNA binding protein [Pseudomonas sp. GD03875]MDH1067684.1 DNA binding protein [Pseudomonas sp. GD03985]